MSGRLTMILAREAMEDRKEEDAEQDEDDEANSDVANTARNPGEGPIQGQKADSGRPRKKPRKMAKRIKLDEQRLTNPSTGLKKLYLDTKGFRATTDPVKVGLEG